MVRKIVCPKCGVTSTCSPKEKKTGPFMVIQNIPMGRRLYILKGLLIADCEDEDIIEFKPSPIKKIVCLDCDHSFPLPSWAEGVFVSSRTCLEYTPQEAVKGARKAIMEARAEKQPRKK